MQHFTTAPSAASPGLDLFAAAWLERLTTHGGSVVVGPDDTGNTFPPVDPEQARDYKPLPAEASEYAHTWQHAMFTGRTRELLDLLDLVPGGKEAVRAHVRQFPSFSYADGTRGML